MCHRSWVLAAAMAAFVPAPAVSQAPAVTSPPEIVVTAMRIGVPFWKVTGPQTSILLLADGPLPDRSPGRLTALTAALKQGDRVMYPGRTAISLSPFKMLGYYVRWKRMASLPKGVTLQGMLSPTDFDRLQRLGDRALLKKGFERTHPFVLSTQLKRAAFGEPRSGPYLSDYVEKVAKENKLRVVKPTSIAAKPVAKNFFAQDPRAYVPCLMATVDLIEQGRPAMMARTRAWAERRIPAVLASPVDRAFEACIPPSLVALDRPDVRPQIRSLLQQRSVTIAVIPLVSLAGRGGVLDDLQGLGYRVEGPAWR